MLFLHKNEEKEYLKIMSFSSHKWKQIFMTNLLENSSKFEIRYLIKIRSTRLKVISLLETLIQGCIVLIKCGCQYIWFILQLNLIYGIAVNKVHKFWEGNQKLIANNSLLNWNYFSLKIITEGVDTHILIKIFFLSSQK